METGWELNLHQCMNPSPKAIKPPPGRGLKRGLAMVQCCARRRVFI
jgi:hypothetical protein